MKFDFDCREKTLLIIDDEPANLKVMADYLKADGFEISDLTGCDDARHRWL